MVLDGREIVEYVKERHYRVARSLRPSAKLAIINASIDPAVQNYIRAKQRYADDIGATIAVISPELTTVAMVAAIKLLNEDESVDGIIVQLPLAEGIDTDAVLAAVDPAKDVDGLAPHSQFDPGTPTAVFWLLAHHDVKIRDKTCVVVGQGRLVGLPLSGMLEASGANVIRCDEHTKNLATETLKADVLIAATGQPNLITPEMLKPGAVVIDASQDVSDEVRENPEFSVTPKIGGLGPVTVAVLFEHLLAAAAKR